MEKEITAYITSISSFGRKINIHDAVLYYRKTQDKQYEFFLRVYQEVNEVDLKNQLTFRIVFTPFIKNLCLFDDTLDGKDTFDTIELSKTCCHNGFGYTELRHIFPTDEDGVLEVYTWNGKCHLADCEILVQEISMDEFLTIRNAVFSRS